MIRDFFHKVWEHLFLLIKCPFIALSATISNSNKLFEWLHGLEAFRNKNEKSKKKLVLVEHSERYSDLKRFIYTSNGLKPLHPVGCLNPATVKKHACLPSDLHMSAVEVIQLYTALKRVCPQHVESLDPESSTLLEIKPSQSLFSTRTSVRKYETELKSVLLSFILNEKPKKLIDNQLAVSFQPNEHYPKTIYYHIKQKTEKLSKSPLIQSFLDLVTELVECNLLPCIVFTNNRLLCENFAKKLTAHLNSESDLSLSNEQPNENTTINEIMSELSEEHREMFDVGVGWHHSGLSANLKAITEALFRLGKIKIVFATATLALGVHMPCKTVVFLDDSIYLDSFQYRQAAGRAGRRGFDQHGNVVFFNVPLVKVKRLVGSFIPEIRPHFPLSTSFALKFFDNQFQRKSPHNLTVDCLLNKSFWNYTYKSKVSQVHYDAVFSLNFLVDMRLINENGKFSLFSTLLERLHYHEPSNFVLYYLLINGNFHKIVDSSPKLSDESLIEIYMIIICHLFNPQPKRKKSSTLPGFPKQIREKIDEYNEFVLHNYTSFFMHLSERLKADCKSDLNALPLSGISFSRSHKNLENKFVNKFLDKRTFEYNMVSPFAALSGIQDCNLLGARNDLFLNCLSILHIDAKILPVFTTVPNLSNYALKFLTSDDFYSNDLEEILNDGILIGDLINLLKDFNISLKSIHYCLATIAPFDDKVKVLFEKISDKFGDKFDEIYAKTSKLDFIF